MDADLYTSIIGTSRVTISRKSFLVRRDFSTIDTSRASVLTRTMERRAITSQNLDLRLLTSIRKLKSSSSRDKTTGAKSKSLRNSMRTECVRLPTRVRD